MPRTFDDSLAEDLTSVFFSTKEFAKPVTIARGSDSTPDVAAIVVARFYDALGEPTPQNTGVESIDFDIVTTKYEINGTAVDPQKNDVITRANGHQYQVMPIPSKKCFEPTPDGEVLRVHTKRVL